MYELFVLLCVYVRSDGCSNSGIAKDSLYITFCIGKLGLKGFNNPKGCCGACARILPCDIGDGDFCDYVAVTLKLRGDDSDDIEKNETENDKNKNNNNNKHDNRKNNTKNNESQKKGTKTKIARSQVPNGLVRVETGDTDVDLQDIKDRTNETNTNNAKNNSEAKPDLIAKTQKKKPNANKNKENEKENKEDEEIEDIIDMLNEVNDADLESPVVPIHERKQLSAVPSPIPGPQQYYRSKSSRRQFGNITFNVDGTSFIDDFDLNPDGNRIETPPESDDEEGGKDKEKDLLAALEPDDMIKTARSLGVKKQIDDEHDIQIDIRYGENNPNEDENENHKIYRLDPADIDHSESDHYLTDGEAPPTPTQRHETLRSVTNTHANYLFSEQRDQDLQGIDFHGRVIGKRKKGKSKRVPEEFQNEMREKANKGQLIKISEHKDDPHSLKLAGKEHTYAPYLYHNISIRQKSTGEVLSNEPSVYNHINQIHNQVNTFQNVYHKPKEPITLVIFEFESVLCTSMKLIENKRMNDIATTDLQKMLLAFGGVDRLEELHELFCNVILTKPQTACFLLSDELSNTIFKALERTDLAQYFVSWNKTFKGKKRKLSHVIGNDHRLRETVEGKKHLLLLKLIEVK